MNIKILFQGIPPHDARNERAVKDNMPINFENYQIFDISPLISSSTAVFPGDQLFQRQESLHFEKGHNLVLSSINTTLHIGAHTDAPVHYHAKGESIEERSLQLYMGPCQVVEVKKKPGERIVPQDISKIKICAKKILFKTLSFPDPDRWNGDFNSLSPELVDYLGSQGVHLVGIDTPSVDPAQDEKLLSHNAIYKNNMAILEGVVLENVKEGPYTLLCLPLKISKADASPVRAILLKEKTP